MADDARREDAQRLSALLTEWTGEQLDPHKVGKGCLYLKRLDDVDHEALRALVDRTIRVHRGADRATDP